ncbi:uncharacterized protein G2W53_007791 [Senna tora]|nr:uncharacterized protein G2W53_007791 [Senna tora]
MAFMTIVLLQLKWQLYNHVDLKDPTSSLAA